ncbi:hypothetical protein BB737_12750 [Mycobacterium avium subsp. hominissuis]|uniref:Uncharacterized protein n=1 Tax=Mycobacterium avium subsp. hominissuis TaxID=439334 RepID=A0A2A3LE71_MYCAV|nr:hypothetical protein XV03_02655 [Mycobacterium avium subsp. hominissuis]PBJ65462.1 hypothetical protein BB737_12750 [Mycobacterium avium subsp. hominissuis]
MDPLEDALSVGRDRIAAAAFGVEVKYQHVGAAAAIDGHGGRRSGKLRREAANFAEALLWRPQPHRWPRRNERRERGPYRLGVVGGGGRMVDGDGE